MAGIPYNGYLEVWLQRVIKPKSLELDFESKEPLCQIVNGQKLSLWDSSWVSSQDLKKAIDVSNILLSDAVETSEIIQPEEIELFKQSAWSY